MRCPFCQTDDTRVIETRVNDEQGAIRRRRECQDCHRRFTTYERHEEPQLFVIKKDGRREQFDRDKLLLGINRACQKRPVSREKIAEAAFAIERKMRDTLKDEVSSQALGDMVMKSLRNLDEVAYVRYASVYKEFADLTSFREEIEKMFSRARQDRLTELQQSLFEE
ncbi:MAG: transcriptional regulator NrdR [bacterium]